MHTIFNFTSMKVFITLLSLSGLLFTACTPSVRILQEDTDTDKSSEEELSFAMDCTTDRSLDESDLDQSWKTTLTGLYTDLEVWGIGSVCDFDGGKYDGNTLVSFSVFNDEEDNQRAVLFDSEQNILEEATFNCATMGDLGVSEVTGNVSEILDLSCTSGDAGWMRIENFTLDLGSFTVIAGEVVNKEWSEENQ